MCTRLATTIRNRVIITARQSTTTLRCTRIRHHTTTITSRRVSTKDTAGQRRNSTADVRSLNAADTRREDDKRNPPETDSGGFFAILTEMFADNDINPYIRGC